MAMLSKITHLDWADYFKKLPFIINPLKNQNKRLKNVDLPSKRPFYKELNIVKNKSSVYRVYNVVQK